jgi:hypothetical protein
MVIGTCIPPKRRETFTRLHGIVSQQRTIKFDVLKFRFGRRLQVRDNLQLSNPHIEQVGEAAEL